MIQNDVYIEKLAAVMQGGAFNFPFHVGGIKACEKRGVWPDYIEAVSAGSLAGIFWAMKKTDELYSLYDQLVIQGHTMIWTSDFISENKGQITVNVEAIMKYLGLKPNIGTGFKLLTQKNKVFAQVGGRLRELPSLADNTPLFEILKQHVTRAAVQIPYRCRFVCFDTGEAVSVGPEDFDDDTEFCKAIWASATMPGFWKLVDSIRLKGEAGKPGKVYRNCGDGGVRDNSPIMSAKRWIDLDETPNHKWGLIAWNCNNDFLKELYGPLNLFDTVGRTFGIFMNEMGKGDFETFEVVNEIAEANGGTVKGKNKNYKYYNYAKIEPYENELGSSLSTDPDALRNRLRLGRKHTEAYFAAQKD